MTDVPEQTNRFRVDLRGIVTLLSDSLYSSPRVFVRELLQNGIDAITERRVATPGHEGSIAIEILDDGAVEFRDDGIGLTEQDVVELLATIGSSSKRDEFGLHRDGLLGQFGIGLLSCFLVSDEIDVVTRSARPGADDQTVHWVGHGDGTYTLGTASEPRERSGTTVTVRPRPGEEWLRPGQLARLAEAYGELLPVPVTIGHGGRTVPVAPRLAPWELDADSAAAWCQTRFGFAPLAIIPLDVPLTGVRGVAFVLASEGNPTHPSRHRVYLRRMLLGDTVGALLPDWAYFVRAVVDVTGLNPTASREALRDDALLASTREELGRQIRRWMLRTAASDPKLLDHFIALHTTGLCAVALHDDELLQVVRDFVPWHTTAGTVTLAQLMRETDRIDYAASVRDYDALAPVAQAQRFTVVNAGYTYGVETLRRVSEQNPGVSLQLVTAAALLERLRPVAGGESILGLARAAVPDPNCDVELRSFDPPSTPAMYIPDPAQDTVDVEATTRAGAAESDVFAALVAEIETPHHVARPLLVLNAANPVVEQLDTADPAAARDVVGGLYAVALLAARGRFGDTDRALITNALLRALNAR